MGFFSIWSRPYSLERSKQLGRLMRVWVVHIYINPSSYPVRLPHKLPRPSLSAPTIMAYCDRCERWFAHDRALEQHKEDSNSHWACDDCDLDSDFESHDALRQHYIQSENHHFCKECDRHFKFEESRRQHMDDKHHDWYCRQHNRVSTVLLTPDILSRFTGSPIITSRSSSPNLGSIRTINRAWTTTSASSVKRTSMMKMSCGITQLRTTMRAGNVTKSVASSPPLLRGAERSSSALRQLFGTPGT
jgi:hypothetical protein